MDIELRISRDIDTLVSLLSEADEDDNRIRASIEAATNAAYLVFSQDMPIGAAVVHWHPDESEILYIALAPEHRGQGMGKLAIERILTEARQRGVKAVLVGTANSSLDNIAFYQKCGFRLDSVRKDYFDYFEAPVYEHGILIRDMVVLRYALGE